MKRLSISFVLFVFFVLIIILAQGLFAQTPVNPTNAATLVPITTNQITWTDFDDGGGNGPYDVEFDDDPAFGSIDFSDYNTVNTFLNISGLQNNTVYYWRVRDTDIDGSGTDGSWHTYHFTTVLAVPVQSSPANGSSFTYISPVTFTWTMNGNYSNVDFTVTVASDPFYTQDVQTSTVSGVLTTTIAIPKAGTYHWKVDAMVTSGDNSGETQTTAANFSFTMTLPGPTLNSPVNGLTGVSVLPTLQWSTVTGAVSYKLYVDDANDFGTPIYAANQGTNTSKTFDATIPNFPLNNGQKYWWKVSAIDNNGTEYFSTIWHFTVAPGFTVDQHTPSNGQQIQSTSVLLGWSLGHSAVGLTFEVQYKQLSSAPTTETDWSGATSVAVTGTSNSSYNTTISGLTLGKTYYWRVLIKRTATGEYVHYPSPTTYKYFVTEGGTTVSVVPNWPTGGVYVYTNQPQLSWIVYGFDQGLTYEIDYAKDPSTPDGTPEVVGITNKYYQFTSNLWPGATYYWRVRANYSGNYTAWSSTASFVVYGEGTLEVPVPNYPTGGVAVYTNTPQLSWVLSTSGTGLGYQVRYSTSSSVDGSGMLNGPDATNYPASGPFSSNKYLTLPALTPGQTYYWQVRSYSQIIDLLVDGIINYDPQAFSNWSSVVSFVNNGPGTLVVPTPNWPTGGITVYTTSPILTWYLNPYSTGLTYDIDYSNGGAPDGTPEATNISVQYYQLSGLTPGNTVQWRVRSRNSLGQTSGWSSIESFVVAGGTTASYAVANWPTGGTVVYDNTPYLSWYLEGSPLGITGYVVKYKRSSPPANWLTYNPAPNDADGGQYTVSGYNTTSKEIATDVPGGLLYGETYYWAVYAQGTTTFNSAGQGHFVMVGGPSATTVELSYPSNNSTIQDDDVNFSWYVVGSALGITKFTLTYSLSDVFHPSVTTTVDNLPAGWSGNYTVNNLTNGATYYWYVRAYYSNGSYTQSSTFSFTIQQGSYIIVQPWPGSPDKVVVPTTEPTISWILPAPPAPGLTYELEYSTSPDFSNAQVITGITNQYVNVSGLARNTKYYWRVRSKASDGTYSYYSRLAKFDVQGTTDVENPSDLLPKEFALYQNYPNPFNPATTIRFDLPADSRTSLRIFNVLGQEVMRVIENEMLGAGRYSKSIDLSNLPSGIYIYRLEASNFVSTKKMILIK
ncbi:MAG: T9SS type A sorting domain-containing protein [Ignavibacteria bacterium]